MGIVGTGFLAVPVPAGSAAAGIAGLLGKDWAFSRSMGDAPICYALVSFATIGGVLLTLLHVNPLRWLTLAIMAGAALLMVTTGGL